MGKVDLVGVEETQDQVEEVPVAAAVAALGDLVVLVVEEEHF